MNLLKLLFKAIASNREPDALPRTVFYRWRCNVCGDRGVSSPDRVFVGGTAQGHRRRSGGKCPTPKMYASEV